MLRSRRRQWYVVVSDARDALYDAHLKVIYTYVLGYIQKKDALQAAYECRLASRLNERPAMVTSFRVVYKTPVSFEQFQDDLHSLQRRMRATIKRTP